MEQEVVDLVDTEVGKRKGFANRSQAIETCVRQLLEIEESANGSVNFMIDFLKLLEEQPEIGKKYIAFLKEEKRRREENLTER